jgi:hypothetical protein
MTETAPILVLISELEKSRTVLARIDAFYQDYLRQTSGTEARRTEQAIVIADLLSSFYTCLETLFLRISRFFENSLAADRWHQDLLEKMTLSIPQVREPLISDETAALLGELLKFRHFKRYYFEFSYDWDRLEFVQKKYAQLQPLLCRDLDRFRQFLSKLAQG